MIVTYQSNITFTAVFANTEYLIEIDGEDIIWEGERYIKQNQLISYTRLVVRNPVIVFRCSSMKSTRHFS